MASQEQLAAALANLDSAFAGRAITAPKAYAAHLAGKAELEAIRRENEEAIKSAPGYSAAMGCFLNPKAEIAFMEAQRARRAAPRALALAAE
jgi:hypothetical protein